MNIINFLNLKSKNKMSKLEDDLTSNNKTLINNNIKPNSNESKSINKNSVLIYNENKWTRLLAKYFETINTIDNSLEQIRSKLNEQNNFSSLNLFNYLDKKSKQFLTLNDFMIYLKENNIIFLEKNLRKFIHNFDKDNDFSLNYKEFLGIITPKKKDLKNIDTLPQDKVDSMSENNSISDEIKKIFGELISEELNLVEKCYELSQNIRNSKEFTTYEAFKEIVGEEKYINVENLKNYLKNKNIDITDVEINQLMFRIDSDNDGMISYEEFKNIFLPLNYIEYNQNENEKEKEKDIKNNTFLNNINENNYNNERNNYVIDLPLKLSNNNRNKNVYNNNINNIENKENNKNEINIKQNFNFDININNKEKTMDYNNNDENEDFLNNSHSLYEEKNINNNIEILEDQNNLKEKDKANTINANITNINGDNLLELNNQSKIKNEGDFYINDSNNLIYQTKSILGFMHQKNNNSNNQNINDNQNEAKKNYNSLRASYKNEKKQRNNIKAKNGGNLIDTLLNFDYSKNSNEDIAKNLYCLEYKDKDISLDDFNKKPLKENKDNYPYTSKLNEKDKNSFNELYNNDYKLDNNSNNFGKENNVSTYILNSKNYKNRNEVKNLNSNKSEIIIDEEIDSQQINNKNNKNNKSNNKSNYSSYMNNYSKYKLNNDNNNYYKKIKLNQNKLNVNNSFSTYYIRHNPKSNQNLSENLYIDSLENSITINKNKNYYNQQLERNMQDNASYSINNSNTMNHSMINLNNKTKKNLKETSFKRIYIDKGNSNNLSKSCFMLSLDDQNNLDDVDNEYNNENIDYNNFNKMSMKFCRNCFEKRCPKCNCIQAKIRFIDKEDENENEKKFENNEINNINNANNINSSNNDKIRNSKCSSLPKYSFKKSNTLTAKIDSSTNKFRYYLESSHNNNNFKINSLNASNNNSNNKISKNTYKKQKELNFNKKCNSLYNLMMNYLKQDTSIEEIRQLLSTKEDANLTDLFEIFDHSSKECIGSMDFLQTLKEFGLILNMDDIKFFYKKFNKNINDYFDYEEFSEIILPKKYSNAKIMGEKSNEDFFDLSDETKNIICLLFQNIIEGEKSNENFRKIIGIEEESNGFDLFNKIKKNYSIGIYKEDLANFMKKNKHRLNNRDIELLMERFDKNKDGMIDFKEFLSEISPLD